MINRLKIASCQFPISEDIKRNATYIKRYMKSASSADAGLVHFSETALSGYGGVDFFSWESFNRNILEEQLQEIVNLAKNLNIWVILGSTHFEESKKKPTNCLYIISNKGEIVDRYDKRMLTRNDIKFYSPGDTTAIKTININNVKLGFLICYDSSFQEMFDEYKNTDTDVILLSLYNAKNKGKSFLDEITPAMIRTRAVDNDIWIIANNSSAFYSNWPTCITSPDGKIIEKLSRHRSGILYHEFPDNNYKKWHVKWNEASNGSSDFGT